MSEAVNSVFIKVYYEWNVITADQDDNKFFDTAIEGNADYLVTNDTHCREASSISFPKVNIVGADEFPVILQKM